MVPLPVVKIPIFFPFLSSSIFVRACVCVCVCVSCFSASVFCPYLTLCAAFSYSGQLKSRKMVPENDFHQKDLPTRNAVPTMVQN
ncbi:hypothetical protein E2320_013047, partial [Naja naja]